MKLPAALQQRIEAAAGDAVVAAAPVAGGCISKTAQIELRSGHKLFLKWGAAREQPNGLFSEEAKSLRALQATGTVRVPAVLHEAADNEYSWLLLEWLEPGTTTRANQHQLGQQLAELHRSSAPQYGWPSSNFIGSLPQSNQHTPNWPEFWREQRLQPQLDLAGSRIGAKARRRFDALLARCQDLLADAQDDGPSLLHGDLWNGNVHMLRDGSPALIDPASYYGHREVDLAMARLFGGFTPEFYRAYEQAYPVRAGLESRILCYQLYYLLVHVNLFGGGYLAQTMSVVEQLGC